MLPRLILQAGLLIIGFLVLFVEIAYFSGASQRINGWVIWIYEVRESKKFKKKEKIEVMVCKPCFIFSKKRGAHGQMAKTLVIHVIDAGSIAPVSKKFF